MHSTSIGASQENSQELERVAKYLEAEQVISAFSEEASLDEIVKALQEKGLDATKDEQRIRIDLKELGTLHPDPQFIRSRQRVGFCEATNTGTDHMCFNEVENAIDSLEVAAHLASQPTNRKWKWILIAVHHSMHSFMVAALTCGNPDNVLDWGKNEDEGIILKNDRGIWKSRKIRRKNSRCAYTIQWEQLQEEPQTQNTKHRQEPTIRNEKSSKRQRDIIGFWTALARVMDGRFYMNRYYIEHDCALELTDEQWASVHFATKVRNSLTHFSPALHSFDVPSMQNTCLHLLEAIEFIAFLPVYIHYDVNGRGRVKLALEEIRGYCQ